MKSSVLLNIFLRSLTIQASYNFRRMQNLGFVFSLLPLIRREEERGERMAASLASHLQMFNTHPYFAAPAIGSLARFYEEGEPEEAVDHLKKVLMGPYAAIGDSFFWGALRSFSAVAAVIVALRGSIAAPLVFLLLYTPAHLLVRVKGFLEGYRRGRNGIDFIRGLDLPAVGGRIRILSSILVGILAAVAADTAWPAWILLPDIALKTLAFSLLLLCFLGIRRGISTVKILYGITFLCMVLSI
jgi:PTS system mannose-specific IID component